jgi:hypothetical protein
MSVLVTLIFCVAAGAAIYSLIISIKNYGPKILFLLNGDYSNTNALQVAGAVWPTRLRIREEDITGVPQVLFRRRKPFVRKASLHPIYTRQRITRQLRYAIAPEQVIVLA